MSARNFPASFWNSNYVPPTPIPTHHHQMSDLYSTESSLYSTEPWVHPGAYNSYAAHAYHHNMAQYGSLLRLPQQYAHGHSSRWEEKRQSDAKERRKFLSVQISKFQITSRSADRACSWKCRCCLFKLSHVWWVRLGNISTISQFAQIEGRGDRGN